MFSGGPRTAMKRIRKKIERLYGALSTMIYCWGAEREELSTQHTTHKSIDDGRQ